MKLSALPKLAVALTLVSGLAGCNLFKGQEDPPPAAVMSAPPPAPSPAPTPTPAVVVMPEEDAGAPAPSATASAKAPASGGGSAATIAKCCAALSQNANSAPPDQKAAYMTAATVCNGLKGTPVAQQAFAQIRSFLAGAKMPSACQ